MSCVTRFVLLRGTTPERLAFTPKKGELVFDCDLNRVFVGDGVTAGGLEIGDDILTTLTINSNILTYTDENGNQTNIDLTPYLDDTNLSRLVNGTVNGTTGIATFERDDNSTFTMDFSDLIDLPAINQVQANLDQEVLDRVAADNSLQSQITSNDTEISSIQAEQTTQNTNITNNTNNLNTHINDNTNPHSVTADQVGLGNVDNTSDADKPVSTAQQAELNLKYDTSNPAGYIDAAGAPVQSINGETGFVIDVAKTDEINTFTSRQEIGTNPLHDNAFDYSDAKLTIIENDNNGGNSPNGQKDILHLTREGISGQAFANKASFAIGRYENSGTSSRSQLDIKLTDDSFNSHNEVMSLRSNGNIGLGVTAPTKTLDVNGEARIRTIPQVTNVDFITLVDNDGCVEKISLDDFIELTQAPTISGSVISGQFISVIGYPVGKGPSSTHQWFLDGNPISGATSTTYLVQSSDEGKSISLQLDGGLSSNILSNFYPLDITGLEYWFDPTSGITVNSGRITAWENRGTINVTATPTQSTNGPFLDTVQGLPAVSTNGPNGVTANLNVNSVEGVTSTHSLVVISTSGPTVNDGWRTLIRDFNAGHPLLSNGNTKIGSYGAGGFTSVPSLTMGLNERLIISLKYNTSSGDLDIAKNGGPYSSANSPNKNASNGGAFRLGGSSTSSQSYGQMGDVFIKNGIMSDSDIKKLEGYVAHKYDNTDLLPVGHPYKTEAP